MARNVIFRQADVKRAVKGAISAGMAIGRVELDAQSGKIIILCHKDEPEPVNALDKWLTAHAR